MENQPNQWILDCNAHFVSSCVPSHRACGGNLYVYPKRLVGMEMEREGPFVHIWVTRTAWQRGACGLSQSGKQTLLLHSWEPARCPGASGRKHRGWALGPLPRHRRENHFMRMGLPRGNHCSLTLNLARPFPMALEKESTRGEEKANNISGLGETRQKV